jgi:hypothetical protein
MREVDAAVAGVEPFALRLKPRQPNQGPTQLKEAVS